MSVVLGRDWAARFASRFGGRLYQATLTKKIAGAYDASDPSGPPTTTSPTYTCSAIALGYNSRFVANERTQKGDYQVLILRGTLLDSMLASANVLPSAGDTILIPPPRGSVAVLGRIVGVDPITEAFATCHVKGSLS